MGRKDLSMYGLVLLLAAAVACFYQPSCTPTQAANVRSALQLASAICGVAETVHQCASRVAPPDPDLANPAHADAGRDAP